MDPDLDLNYERLIEEIVDDPEFEHMQSPSYINLNLPQSSKTQTNVNNVVTEKEITSSDSSVSSTSLSSASKPVLKKQKTLRQKTLNFLKQCTSASGNYFLILKFSIMYY